VSGLLEVRGVSKRFGGLLAVREVEFTLAEGELRAHLRDRAHDQRAGHDDPARRAERAPLAHGGARGYVLENGRIVLSGAGKDLLANERLRTAYLGM
jgi:ABC-type branched-subunit amino acid transport system ATPase component